MKKPLILSILLALLLAPGLCTSAQAQTLLIYGGQNHDEYLGQFNGGKHDHESIWNRYGPYGDRHNARSIWNKYGTYGGTYSQYSPWNPYAAHPPVLKDRNGKVYGTFTANTFKAPSYLYANGRNLAKIITFLCKHHDAIRDEPWKWYDDLF